MPRAKRDDGRNPRTVASNKYSAANYERISFFVPKGEKEKIKAAAAATGKSMNAFIYEALTEKLKENE